MDLIKLQEAIQAKTAEFEKAKQLGKPPDELLTIYKELKELQYQKVLADHSLNVPNDLNVK
jgi:hypothetical protein